MKDNPVLIIRADGNESIGSGHIMRCSAIAVAVSKMGCDVLFAVSDERSAGLLKESGFEYVILRGNPSQLTKKDGALLYELAYERNVPGILVDSYAVSDEFFGASRSSKTCVTYIDDTYNFATGLQKNVRKWPVDFVINYSLGAIEEEYRLAYAGTPTIPLIGPAYAPVRTTFSRSKRELSEAVRRVLITCGSTNPCRTLEKMTEACIAVLPDAKLDVVVGGMADYELPQKYADNVVVNRGVVDLSPLMRTSDLAVSAAGATLYELCCVGIPTVALPIVENQMANAKGFGSLGMGLSSPRLEWDVADVIGLVAEMAGSVELRVAFKNRMQAFVDGLGTERIAGIILGQ